MLLEELPKPERVYPCKMDGLSGMSGMGGLCGGGASSSQPAILKEDGGYLLMEDGSHLLME
ncbi:MAG: hypothetical protein K2R98_19535 [Gemmataceae bacterium]|nr:hypothetical protein [Gemmataceae bacterium]